jgi:hypothetical protein
MTDQLRIELLHLHKLLLDKMIQAYELRTGKSTTTNERFQLVVNDPGFQWLRALSETIVAIDEALEATPPASHTAIIAMVKGRLFPSTRTEFSSKLAELAQTDQEVSAFLQFWNNK